MTDNPNSLIQTATAGPTRHFDADLTWRHHILLLLSVVIWAMIIMAIASYNIAALYRANPGYGRSLETERAFCRELDETFVSSRYAWDEMALECRVVEMEANNDANR